MKERLEMDETGKAAAAEPKVPYPRAVFFIIFNELCERFSFISMRAVLVLFLKNELGLSEDDSTVMFHAFNMTCYAFPIIGGIVADSWLGMFWTISSFSLVYAVGNIVLTLASWTPLGLPAFPLTCVGLLFIAVGTGGIKPCVCTFGGDQFQLPQQRDQLEAYFRLFYFVINGGATMAALVAPIMRATPCLDRDTCFPAAFGMPAVLLISFCALFVAGRPLYRMKDPGGNVLLQVCKCISRGLWRRVRRGPSESHWLDTTGPEALVADIKALLSLLVLALPMPVFWALFDMVASRWTFQAVQLNGYLGYGVTLQPDQMQMSLNVMVMMLLVVFEVAVNPLLARANLMSRPLQRMAVGGLMAAGSFICAAVLQIYIDRAACDGGKVHLLWQGPQYFFMALAEIWFAIGVLEFGYKEAPMKMKSTIQAIFLLTTSFGDILVIGLTSANLFSSRTTEFFVYAVLMTAVMVVFIFLAARYKYVDQPADPASSSKKEPENFDVAEVRR